MKDAEPEMHARCRPSAVLNGTLIHEGQTPDFLHVLVEGSVEFLDHMAITGHEHGSRIGIGVHSCAP